MDGFKNTTKTQYSMGGYAKGGSKFGKVMGEFKAGTLHSGSKKGPEVTNPKQAVAIAISEARKSGAKTPMKKYEGGSISRKTGDMADPEYGDFVAAGPERDIRKLAPGVARKPAPVVRKGVPVASRTPMVPAKKPPLARAMFGDEAAAAMDRSGKAGMTAAEKREGYKHGGSAKGPSIERSKSVSTKSKVTPTMNAQEVRRMEKYKAAMASRPNRQPVVAEGKRTAAALTPIIRRAMAAKAAQAAQAAQAAAPAVMDGGLPPMAAPAMKKGGKARFQVMRKAEGGAVVGYDVGGAVNLSFTPPSAAPAGQRWIQRDDGQLLLVSTDPNATYVGRSGTVKKVSDLSVYQGGEADRPVADFVANTAPDVLANLRSVGGLDASYDVPDAGEIGNRQNAKLSFTPPGVAPAGQRYVQRDDGALVLVSTDPNATYTGRSGTVKNVSDLSIYQGGNAYIPAANFAANSAPEVIANLQRVGGLSSTYKAPAAGTLAPPPSSPMPPQRTVNPSTLGPSTVAGGRMGSVSNPVFQNTGNVDPRNLAETYRASVPGYSYGEDPVGERQFFNYAVAPGAPPPYTVSSPVVPMKTGGAVSASKAAPSTRSAQKYAAAMASRPNREPIIKRDMGGMASSVRSTKDYHKADTDFVAARGEQLNTLVGRRMAKGGEGGKADLKQDKALVKTAVHKHERAMHPGKPMTKLRKGGTPC